MKRFSSLSIFALLILFALSCDKNNNVSLFFSTADDLALGQQVSGEIAADPSFNLMARMDYPDAYAYLDSMTLAILNSQEVVYRDEFAWEVTLVQDDNTLNAFATPGGYIYVYTGLIKYLNDADALAGVMGHEIAHADLRHTSRSLQRQYGVSLLLGILVGEDASTLETIAAQVAGTAAGLSFSREFETESDERSVEYLAATGFACDGAKIFFELLEASGQGSSTPEFLSTHPNPENRIENINDKAAEENCDTTPSSGGGYAAFVNSLP
jgi:predicted Zn-dependent protease